MAELEPIANTGTNPNPTEPTQTVESTPIVKTEPATKVLTQAEIDRMIQQAVMANAEKAKKQAEKEAAEKSMTEAQKVQALADELKAERESLKRERAEVAARAVLASKGLVESDYEELLPSIVGTDVDETKDRAEKVGAKILAIAENLAKNKMQEQIQNTPKPNATPNNSNATPSLAEQYKSVLAEAQKNPHDKRLMEQVFAMKERLLKETR